MAAEAASSIDSDVNMVDSAQETSVSVAQAANGKRKAETELDEERTLKKSTPSANDEETHSPEDDFPDDQTEAAPDGEKKMTKNQLKKLKRKQAWEARREDRKVKRKDKRHEKQAKKREEKQAILEKAVAEGKDPEEVLRELAHKPVEIERVPVTFVIDCDFEQYMREHEIGSLSAQVVRSYSMNRKSKYQANLAISGFKGALKDIFTGKLSNTHKNWKNVAIEEGSFIEAAKHAYQAMTGLEGGKVIDIIKPESEGNTPSISLDNSFTGKVAPEAEDVDQTIVYLTSDSPYTLERLEANTSYIIGGIVDRNREKGLCYKRALEHKVRHAKLPIGEFMRMQSRFVLTTNQVVEIMAKWLQCGDWAEAFMDVIPKRKGGVLKGQEGEQQEENAQDEDGQEDDGQEEDERKQDGEAQTEGIEEGKAGVKQEDRVQEELKEEA
ncbi:guanine-1-methyltransferase-domain-containing protein [Cladorrhinum samala]|uniref:tRNA (guanine(9)-N1)-methyltransferase n=1 Tax=Cladorrhinum samala TaxID=585594 RepID=A0AAV9HNV0_9PEZI|nr:guanine-1-methyltransferase-domain-containing protein [Cladorrhinum samala]